MTELRLRPRFRQEVACPSGALLSALDQRLSESADGIRGTVFQTSCVLRVPENDVQFWSPQLEIAVEPQGESGAVVHGLYGPRPAVWSMFVALYVGIAFIGLMGVIFGYSQSLLGHSAWAYWAGPVSVAAAIGVYLIARTGRRLGYSQMAELRRFYDASVSLATREANSDR